jgi:hypothetical protein
MHWIPYIGYLASSLSSITFIPQGMQSLANKKCKRPEYMDADFNYD